MKILFLGCGKMGSILAKNLVEEKSVKAAQITVLEKSDQNKISGFFYAKNISSLPKNYCADLVFLCIKPQDAEAILKEFSAAKIFSKNTIFISILAGKKIAFFENIFGKKAKIIRSMPNLPIQDSQGVFAYLANKNISQSELKNLAKIFDKFGAAFELKDEKFFDVITAIFGSGPAYIFLLQEIFTEIAINHSIAKDKASQLIQTLLLGSSLMSCNSNLNFSELRESVTSKAGTTEAALKILQKNSALKNLFKEAIDAAIKKSQELSKT
jgi:pyrroline-5-carboxylate reductase